LKHHIIVSRIETFKTNDEIEDGSLLQTIRVPKNLLFLTERLPKANYEKPIKAFTKKAEKTLPELSKVKKKKKDVKTEGVYRDNDKKYEIDIRLRPSDQVTTPKRQDRDENLNKNKENLNQSGIRMSPKRVNNIDLEGVLYSNETRENRNLLPVIKNSHHSSEYKYDISSVRDKSPRHSNIVDIKKIKRVEPSLGLNKNGNINLGKILPYVNNEHISNVYKYSPGYLKQGEIKSQVRHNIDKGILYKNNNYNHIEKKGINSIGIGLNNGKLPAIPNRKLSPIRRQV
jgi:hypothetical protein